MLSKLGDTGAFHRLPIIPIIPIIPSQKTQSTSARVAAKFTFHFVLYSLSTPSL